MSPMPIETPLKTEGWDDPGEFEGAISHTLYFHFLNLGWFVHEIFEKVECDP